MFYELNDELIVFWNLGETSENKSQINREKWTKQIVSSRLQNLVRSKRLGYQRDYHRNVEKEDR